MSEHCGFWIFGLGWLNCTCWEMKDPTRGALKVFGVSNICGLTMVMELCRQLKPCGDVAGGRRGSALDHLWGAGSQQAALSMPCHVRQQLAFLPSIPFDLVKAKGW